MNAAGRTPVIVGCAQSVTRPPDLPGQEPVKAWESVIRAAFEDAGLSRGELANIDRLGVVNCMSWEPPDPTAQLAALLGASPRYAIYSEASGTSGHKLVQDAADAIRRGEADLAVVVGGESFASKRAYAKAGEQPPWGEPSGQPPFTSAARQHPDEVAAGLAGSGAVQSFALRDVARRAHLGVSPEAYRADVAELFAGMTSVAATNPYAWFPTERDADFLGTVRPDNRMVAYPYTKHLVAIMDVDLSAALVLMSTERAQALGVPEEQFVYPWSAALLHDPVYIAARPELWKSPAMHTAARAVLDAVDVDIDAVKYLDLYSCFASAVNFGLDALGTSRPGDRVTVTGGLPYAGGAGSAYVVNSIAGMVQVLRTDPDELGLVSGLGMLMSDHAYGIYGGRPAPAHQPVDEQALQRRLDERPTLPIVSGFTGTARVAAYTLTYDRESNAVAGAAICDVPDGRICARFTDAELLAQAEETEFVGADVEVRQADGLGLLLPATVRSAVQS